MPPTGSTFTDWQRVEQESRLLINEDFSWSEPPQRRRRRITEEPIRARRRAAVTEEYEPVPEHAPLTESEHWHEPDEDQGRFDELMAEWDGARRPGFDGDRRSLDESIFDLSDPGAVSGDGARRTVVITGRGDDRYMPAPRRPRSAELRFHERSSFSPDRAGLWAVLLGIALVIGCIAH